MTKAYSQMSALDALYTAARRYPGSVEAMALRLNKSPEVLRKKLQPDVESHHITLSEALDIIELLDGTVPDAADLAIGSIAWRLDRAMVRLPKCDSSVDELLQQVLVIFAEEGKLSQDISVALSNDGKIDARELDMIEADLSHSIEALMSLRDKVREKHHHDFPSIQQPRGAR